MSKKEPKVWWEDGSFRIVERDEDQFMAGPRRGRQLTLQRRDARWPDGWSGGQRVDFIGHWPFGTFFNRSEAIAFLRGVASATR